MYEKETLPERFRDNDLLASIWDLTEAQMLHYYEPEPGIFIAESDKVISRALEAGYEPLAFYMESRLLEEMKWLYAPYEVPVEAADLRTLIHLVGYNLTKGVICVMRRKVQPTLQELCRNATRIAILENVENPTNVGAIFRSAAALGIDAVILGRGSSDPLYRRSARVSVGTVFQVPWCVIDRKKMHWPQDVFGELKRMGFQIAGMALREDTVSLAQAGFPQQEKLAIVLGNEGEGMTHEAIGLCDQVVKIPMEHGVDSLNVSVASAIAFWAMNH